MGLINFKQIVERMRPKRGVYYYWFAIGCVGFGLVALFSLRANNLTMIRLRDEVFIADKNGGDVEASLRALREYVYGHMNTSLVSGENPIRPPIQLKYTYERLVTAEKERTKVKNAGVYDEATIACEAQYGQGKIQERAKCVSDFVAARGVTEIEEPIPDALYKFDFTSPRWSPDIAGLSLLISGVCFVGFIIRFLSDRAVRKYLQYRQ
jgi:hypothetical protein